MFKFIHCADVHLDSPLVNLDRYDGAPVDAFRSAARRAFDNMVDLAIAEKIDFLLIAGDLYDGDCSDFNTPLHFRRRVEELKEHGIRVYLLHGNHDAASKMKKAFRLDMPDNVHVFKTTKPETVLVDEYHVAIHGQGFAKQAVEEDLSAAYPKAKANWFNIGMLHTSCGTYDAHDTYAPSTVSGLTSKGYDFWALGHIHKREQLAGPTPMIWYPGNLQGRHIREQGAKGCSIVTVDDGEPVKVRFAAVDVLRWHSCDVDATANETADEVIDQTQAAIARLLEEADGRPIAVRVEITGESPAHRELKRYESKWDEEIRTEAVSRFDDQVWIEKIKFRTESPRSTANAGDVDTPMWELVQSIEQSDVADEALSHVRDDLAKMLKSVPTDHRLSEDTFDLDDESDTSQMITDARELLVSRMLETGEQA